MAVDLTNAINTASLNSKLLVAGVEQVTKSKVLSATSGYTPTVGDILVKNLADSSSDNVFDFDDMYESNTSTLVSAAGTLNNVTMIIPDSLKVSSGTAYADSLAITLGTQYSFVNSIPATIDVSLSGSAAITLSAAFSYQYLCEGNQKIIGVITEIDQTDTANITLEYLVKGGVHYTACNTDGTEVAAAKTELISKLEDLGIIVVNN